MHARPDSPARRPTSWWQSPTSHAHAGSSKKAPRSPSHLHIHIIIPTFPRPRSSVPPRPYLPITPRYPRIKINHHQHEVPLDSTPLHFQVLSTAFPYSTVPPRTRFFVVRPIPFSSIRTIDVHRSPTLAPDLQRIVSPASEDALIRCMVFVRSASLAMSREQLAGTAVRAAVLLEQQGLLKPLEGPHFFTQSSFHNPTIRDPARICPRTQQL